jgi:hypothetical protein
MANKVNLDIAEKLNITCRKGDTFTLTLTLKDSSGTALTLATSGYEFLMQVRGPKNPRTQQRPLIMGTSTKGRLAEKDGFSTNFTFTTDDSGNVTITASNEVMEKVDAGKYYYDLQQIVDNVNTTILEGLFIVNDDISKTTL